MISPGHLAERAIRMWRDRGVLVKAMSFAVIGAINAAIDASVFFLAYVALGLSASSMELLGQIVALCRCGSVPTIRLIAANLIAWVVAVSGSYVMNSFVTFAAESGGRLRWRAYLTFVASGIAGLTVNTVVLVLAAQAVPVWAAKGLAILAGFVVNFSLSHYVVFRPRASR